MSHSTDSYPLLSEQVDPQEGSTVSLQGGPSIDITKTLTSSQRKVMAHGVSMVELAPINVSSLVEIDSFRIDCRCCGHEVPNGDTYLYVGRTSDQFTELFGEAFCQACHISNSFAYRLRCNGDYNGRLNGQRVVGNLAKKSLLGRLFGGKTEMTKKNRDCGISQEMKNISHRFGNSI